MAQTRTRTCSVKYASSRESEGTLVFILIPVVLVKSRDWWLKGDAQMRTAIAALTVLLTTAAAFADPPPWAGKGKHDREYSERSEHRHNSERRHFEERHMRAVHEYYGEQFRGGHCPPGLAKKHNGCMPPGQARAWAVGRPLPQEVVYYEVPQPLVVQLPPPPPAHRYVRVAGDILLIAAGTGMVIDAIQDLGRMK